MSAPVPAQRAARDWLRPYRLLKEPRVVSALYGMAYVVVALGIGLPTILGAPQTTLGAHIDTSLVWATGVLTMVGGICALVSLFGGTWFAERAGIALILGGLLARVVIIVSLPEHLADGRPIRLAEVAVVGLLLLARARRIAGLTLDPMRGRA